MEHIINETMNATMDLVKAKIYITNWNNIHDFFKEETLMEVLKNFKVRDFATFEYVPIENTGKYNDYIKRGYVCITPKPVSAPYKETMYYRGKEWQTTNYRLSYEFIVRDNYQLKEGELIKLALEIEFPYLKNFKLSIYHMEKPATEKGINEYKKDKGSSFFRLPFYGNEIYLNVTNESVMAGKNIFVPLLALRNKDAQMIIDRHTSYFKDYYEGVDREEYMKASLALLETPIAKKFFECVKTGI